MGKKLILARVDKRLLHATVTLNWDRFINTDYVVIVGSGYEKDPFIASVLQLSVPKSLKVRILSEQDMLDFMATEKLGKVSKVMIIFKDLATVRRCMELGFWTKEIQLPYPNGVLKIKRLADYFTEEELENIAYIKEKGIKLYFQTSPCDVKDYNSFENK